MPYAIGPRKGQQEDSKPERITDIFRRQSAYLPLIHSQPGNALAKANQELPFFVKRPQSFRMLGLQP